MSEIGTFARVGKTWLVRTKKRVPVGEEVVVQKKDNTIVTMVVTALAEKRGFDYYAQCHDIGSNEAEKARGQGPTMGPPRRMRVVRRKKKLSGPADRPLIRPTSCVGGMTRKRAQVDARARGRSWTPYRCEKCDEYHVTEEP